MTPKDKEEEEPERQQKPGRKAWKPGHPRRRRLLYSMRNDECWTSTGGLESGENVGDEEGF